MGILTEMDEDIECQMAPGGSRVSGSPGHLKGHVDVIDRREMIDRRRIIVGGK